MKDDSRKKGEFRMLDHSKRAFCASGSLKFFNRTPVANINVDGTDFATYQRNKVVISNFSSQLLKPANLTLLYIRNYRLSIDKLPVLRNQKLNNHIGGDYRIFDCANGVVKTKNHGSVHVFAHEWKLDLRSFKFLMTDSEMGTVSLNSLTSETIIIGLSGLINSGQLKRLLKWYKWTKNKLRYSRQLHCRCFARFNDSLRILSSKQSPQAISGYTH